ncbi:hypothetical protein [Chitiniphilus eburneus]|uniref:Uncharacterized protein n=1 Tax=Chitiniphilus eburneus TaxID=2571148 RepID=A0A4U0PMH5_9NEIS|nr:hypothetical protein [Chitiniphilus eburneus]TJZ69381.1 hypothetical protein FAZ21_15065 [Chitiniphilus eburneus]
MIYLWLALALAAVAGLFYLITYNPWLDRYWRRLPTRDEYLAMHPQTRSDEAAHPGCCHCDGREMLDLGLARLTDYRRQFMCRQCKRLLWREQD